MFWYPTRWVLLFLSIMCYSFAPKIRLLFVQTPNKGYFDFYGEYNESFNVEIHQGIWKMWGNKNIFQTKYTIHSLILTYILIDVLHMYIQDTHENNIATPWQSNNNTTNMMIFLKIGLPLSFLKFNNFGREYKKI